MFDTGPLSFHFEMANSKVALKEVMIRVIGMREIKYLHLGCHGAPENLQCFNGDEVTVEDLIEILQDGLSRKGISLSGLHIGACSFGTVNNLERILSGTPKISWISGYSTPVDWLSSAALDMQFIYHFLESEESSSQKRIGAAADAIKRSAPGACKDLGLSVLIRNSSGTKIQNLLEFK